MDETRIYNQEKGLANATPNWAHGLGNSRPIDALPVRAESGTIEKARETLGYISELEALQGQLRERLYGPYPQPGEVNEKRAHEPCLEEMMRMICERSAMAVGELKTILTRL